ncbi:MAG: hypothetical protein ACOZF0_02935 [Thermodesulfobacteriota bacterium]
MPLQTGFTPSMTSTIKDLNLAHLWILYPGDRAYPTAPGVSSLPLDHAADSWRYER